MRDLDLWRRLGTREVSAAELCALAEWTLARRSPYLARIHALADHGDAEIRAGAIRALAGVRGVPGVRAIVNALDDDDDRARAAAVDALRVTARDAPDRYAHALFHPRVDVRRAALVDVPNAAAGLPIYLRADPACADLARQASWPRAPLPLAFDLHAGGQLGAGEFVELVTRVPPAELRAFVGREHRRSDESIRAYLDGLPAVAALAPPPGADVIDQLVAAIADSDDALARRGMLVLVESASAKKFQGHAGRVIAALLGAIERRAPGLPVLAEACIALAPRLLEVACVRDAIGPGLATAAIRGLFAYDWPTPITSKQVARLLQLERVRRDLALAAAIAGLANGGRRKLLAKALGEVWILESLMARDDGWDELCRLPQESPPLELAWLSRISTNVERYIALAGRALGVFRDRRLEAFVDQMPRRHRHPAFLAFLGRADLVEERITAVARVLGARLDRHGAAELLAELLPRRMPIALVLARVLPEQLLGSAAQLLDDPTLALLIAEISRPIDLDDPTSMPASLPRAHELSLALAIARRDDATLRAWARAVLHPDAPAAAPPPRQQRTLDDEHRRRIETCPDALLGDALAPAIGTPTAGLTAALATRTATPSTAACVALLGATDPIEDVARELDRYAPVTPRAAEALDTAAATAWQTTAELPVLAHARLYRWEAHAAAVERWMADNALGALRSASALPGRLAQQTLWRAIAEVIVMWRYRDAFRIARHGSPELARYCAEHVDQPVGASAARILVALVESSVVRFSDIRDTLLERTPDAAADAREHLARLVRLDGMPEPPPAIDHGAPEATLIAAIRAARHVDELVRWCFDPRRAVVQEAVLALVVLGDAGQLRLAAMLRELDHLPHAVPVLASIALWDSPGARMAARELATGTVLAPAWQFHLCLGLGDGDGAIAAVHAPIASGAGSAPAWFRRDDWDALVAVVEPLRAALAVVDAPHHHAYQPSIVLLLERTPDPAIAAALRRFLEVTGDRPLHLRRAVARRLLADHADPAGLPVLIEEIIDEGTPPAVDQLKTDAVTIADAVVGAALVGGHNACSEKRMWTVLEQLAPNLAAADLARLRLRVLEEGSTALARRAAARHCIGDLVATERLVRVAELFAWGTRRGVELAGRLFRFHMTSNEREFGHTRLDGNRIFVTPLPLLRGEAYGKDIVEGLVLHEIGHHVYHRSQPALAIWKQAHDEGLGHLLNLLADEHLERNLRGVDRTYGDRLKRLGAYAFQHAAQEIAVPVLLESLRGSTARALIAADLDVAFDEKAVRLRRGAILTELERAGHPLARFARALRMGLGNRHGDPLVATALAKCAGIRRLDMAGLYKLTQELAELFGGALSIARVFGSPEGLEFGERDDDVFGGIDDDILQREVERILDPRRNKSGAPATGAGRLAINVNPDEQFERITHVQRVTGDPTIHRETVQVVSRHARRLRGVLDDLGLRWEPQRARIAGRALDRTRLTALVTRNDPRLLVARNPVRRTDLFLGTIVDCSGSMQAGDNIDRARRFAILVAEAVQPLAGVEARFFGFTDSVIYDAGDARDCAVTGLVADGGNNDAAALLHAADVALRSQKRAKVLVMISDGLPTECSVAALRGLVTQLTRRRGIICAQVAVRPLEEACFPHHVLLDDDQIDVAVARFGRMVADLVRRGLSA